MPSKADRKKTRRNRSTVRAEEHYANHPDKHGDPSIRWGGFGKSGGVNVVISTVPVAPLKPHALPLTKKQKPPILKEDIWKLHDFGLDYNICEIYESVGKCQTVHDLVKKIQSGDKVAGIGPSREALAKIVLNDRLKGTDFELF